MEGHMPKFLVKASYRPEGTRGLLKEGATSRRTTVQKLVESMGGKLEAFYYAYGDVDVYAICDVPAASNGIALSLAINASGAVQLSLVPLITPEEIDAVTKKLPTYRSPGA
jgi:uncharacterized protein with GYD domain